MRIAPAFSTASLAIYLVMLAAALVFADLHDPPDTHAPLPEPTSSRLVRNLFSP